MRIFFTAIVTVVALFLLGSIIYIQVGGPMAMQLKSWEDWLLGGAALFSLICTIQGRLQFARGIESAKTSLNPLAGKLAAYKKAFVIYMATMELPIILSIILSLTTGNFKFQVFAAVLLGFMLSAMPRTEKVINQLQ